jgi:hypothetical protein
MFGTVVMVWLSRNKLLIIISLVLLVGTSVTSRARKMQRFATGMWGGAHIRINVNEGSADVEYDCANGTIKGPLTVDGEGCFSWSGIHSREHGGPIRKDEKPDSHPASYTGAIKDDTMTLTVKLTDTGETLGTFTLKRGNPGRVFKCR